MWHPSVTTSIYTWRQLTQESLEKSLVGPPVELMMNYTILISQTNALRLRVITQQVLKIRCDNHPENVKLQLLRISTNANIF
jgi:hypothetical protein